MVIGKYEINIWRDPGKPHFRVYFEREEPAVFSGYRTYFWVFKLMSFYTLWVAKFDMGTPHDDQIILIEWIKYYRMKLKFFSLRCWLWLNRYRIEAARKWMEDAKN